MAFTCNMSLLISLHGPFAALAASPEIGAEVDHPCMPFTPDAQFRHCMQSASHTCSMASILSLPDELIELIGIAAEEHAGVRAWCRLASTCRRLWGLQLPQARRGWSLSCPLDIEGKLHRRQLSTRPYVVFAAAYSLVKTFTSNCGLRSGIAWQLQRVQAAPWLRTSMFELGAKWDFDTPETRVELLNSLQQLLEAAAAASRKLHHLRLLVTLQLSY